MPVQAINSSLEDLKLNGKRLSIDLSDAVIGDSPIVRSISSASNIKLTLNDPNAKLIRKPFLNQKSKAEIDGLDFTLSQVSWEDGLTSIALEDSAIAMLRELHGPRKFVRGEGRGQYTRARAIAALFKDAGVRLVSPERNIVQPIARGKAARSRQVDQDRAQGIDRTAKLTVKGARANSKQIEIADQVLRSAYKQFPKVPQRAVVALLCAATHESVMGTLGMNSPVDHDSIGILQGRLIYNSRDDLQSIPYNVRRFMVEPWTGTSLGGAIKQANAGRQIGDICTSIQGNATGDVYTQWKDEALAWIEAFGGGSGLANYEITTQLPYEFEVKKSEDYWQAAKRWAKEVRWRLFISAGVGYYMTDQQLLASRPRHRISFDHAKNGSLNYPPGIDSVKFKIAPNRRDRVNDAKIIGRAARWGAPPGSAVVFDKDTGPAQGRWLVATIATKMTSRDAEIDLRRPVKPLPEPAPETKTREVRATSDRSQDGDASTEALSRVKIGDNDGAGEPWWGGSWPIYKQFIIPFMARKGLSSWTGKRSYNTGQGTSDHFVGSLLAFAADFGTTSGESIARELAAAMGYSSWSPDSYASFPIRVDGHTFTVQILWGAAIDHDDHIHVGMHRV